MPNTFGYGTDTTGFSDTVVKLVHKAIIETLRSGLVYLPRGSVVPAQQKPGYNGTMVHVAYPDLPVFTTDLTEGIPPTGSKLGIDKVEYTCTQKGNYVKLTDLAELESPHQLAKVAANKIEQQMVETVDELARLVWATHATDLYSGTSNAATLDVAAGDVLTAANAMDAVAILRAKNVAPFANGDYLAITHPYVLRGLANDKRFVEAAKYGDPSRLFKGSIGGFEGAQFVPTSRGTKNAGAGTAGIDVFETIVIGANSIAFGDIGTLEVIIEKGGVSDPLHQLKTVGWKAFIGGALVKVAEKSDGAGVNAADVDRMVTIESASGLGIAPA
jgi:N4-gp56 family major capsid protein